MLKNNLHNAKVIEDPYPHLICDDFLCDYEEFHNSYPKSFSNSPIRMHKDLTFGDESYNQITNSKMNDLHEYVYSKRFINDFLTIFKSNLNQMFNDGMLLHDPFSLPINPDPYEMRNYISRKNYGDSAFLFPRIDFGIGYQGYGVNNGGKGPHVDNITRVISILMFFTDQKEIFGGEHRLYEVDGNDLMFSKKIKVKKNRLLASIQSNNSFHDVKPLMRGERKAIYLSISCSKPIWKDYDNKIIKKLSQNRR